MFLISLLLLATLQTPPVANQNSSLAWDYQDSDIVSDGVTNFLVCMDSQPTANCTQVPLTNGVASSTVGTKTYTFRFPPLVVGPHIVAVQACTLGDASCSTGSSLQFTVQIIIPNVSNLRVK